MPKEACKHKVDLVNPNLLKRQIVKKSSTLIIDQ